MAKLSYGRNPKMGQYVSAGRASDGVVILRQAAKPKHFTLTEIEKTVAGIKAPGDRRRISPGGNHPSRGDAAKKGT